MSRNAPTAKRPRKSSSVPGQALGYSLQFTRMAAMLFEAGPGSLVSFEVFEDVGEDSREGIRTFEQSKSALTYNPLGDHSVDLWKTMANWVDAIKNEPRSPDKIRFKIYVSRPATGNLADKFHAAKSVAEAKAALREAKEILRGGKSKPGSQKPLSAKLAAELKRVVSAPEEILVSVIQAFTIERGSGSPQTDFAEILDKHYVPRNRVETVANYASGWVKRQVDKLLEQRKPAVIAWEDFHQEMTIFIRKVAERDILQSFAPEPSPSEQTELLPKLFVRQMDLIELEFTERLEAVSHFFKASLDRTKWGESGEVHPSSLDELDGRLSQTWKNHKRKTFIQAADKADTDKGKLLFSECMLHKDTLEGAETPLHFIPGCFHLLADDMKVGWHPKYVAELTSNVAKTTS